MAPLPPNGTPRFRFNYTVGGLAHSFQVRSHGSPSLVGGLVDGVLTQLSDGLFDFTLDTVDFAADNSDIFIPVITGIEGETYGDGTPTDLQKPWFYGFQGRGATGRKWHLDIFGAIALGNNYIWSPGEYTVIDNAVAALQAFGSDLVDIADAQVTVYTYVNGGANSHFQRKART